MKTLTAGKIVLGTIFLIIVIVVRLLFMLDSKIDRPSVAHKEQERELERQREYRAMSEMVWREAAQQAYQQQQRQQTDWLYELKRRQARDAQIRREEYIRAEAREAYRNDTPDGRAMRMYFGY